MKNSKNNKVWAVTEQLTNDPSFAKAQNQEFSALPVLGQDTAMENTLLETNRRDFLKYLGFGIGAATLAAGCDIPVRRAIPYVSKPDTIVPGVATYYASTFVRGGDYCPVLVKTREGRPIKIEGNAMSTITGGGTSARAQASVLSMYDTSRFDGPFRITEGAVQYDRKQAPSWEEFDAELRKAMPRNARVRIVTHTLMSPSVKAAIADFAAAYPQTRLVQYDPVSSAALLAANEQGFGIRAVPQYHFDRANVIVAFDCDFLGTWISPIEYAAQYATNRKIKDVKTPRMSRHIQVESNMSMTGSNADNRILVKPSQQGAAILALYQAVVGGGGGAARLSAEQTAKIQKVAAELKANRGSSLVVSGSNNLSEQTLVNAINDALGNYGRTLDFDRPSYQRQGDDRAVQQLITDMNAGNVDVLMVMDGANPAYDLPNADQFAAGMAKVGVRVSLAGVPNDTVAYCTHVAPDHHYLESWGDVEAKAGVYSMIQPTIAPIFASVGRVGTRQAGESLLTWAESDKLDKENEQPWMAYLASQWEQNMFGRQAKFATFQAFWDSSLHDGIFVADGPAPAPAIGGGVDSLNVVAPVATSALTFGGNTSAAAGKVRQPAAAEAVEISFFETVNIGNGEYADNPWLQEMPDPVTRCVWGNYLSIPVKWNGGNNWDSYLDLNSQEFYGEADYATVNVNGTERKTMAIRQFGQLENTVGLALGYGREVTGRAGRALADKVGVNVYPWLTIDEDGFTQYHGIAEVTKTGEVDKLLPCVQYHHTMGVNATNESGEKLYYDKETEEEVYLAGELTADQKKRYQLFNVDEKTVMGAVAGFQGGLTNRSIIYQGHVAELPEMLHHIEEKRAEAAHLNNETLYPFDEYSNDFYSQGHHWAMHIDLNACTGCGACQVACVAENNVPVVGKIEVARHHEMAWLRIDRYYYGDYENPSVVYQPMLCQHCDNAPCENVCPVAATNHSSEGLNQMTYNRCIGTRYCANNCPYKVRRFNWLDYTTADLFSSNEPLVNNEELPFGADNLTRMVLNPDVTVRSRGVIEKCSFCVQRIQAGKLQAKVERRSLQDTDVRTACQTACPTGAITFGDRNNKQGEVAERIESPLNYLVLEETNTQPSVFYSARVNNRSEEMDA